MRTLCTACLLVVLLGAVDAQAEADWVPGGPEAGTIVGIAATSLAVFVATPAAVFRSTDRGAHWVSAMTGLRRPDGAALQITALVADPMDPAIVWLGTRDAAVFRTRDGGESWSRVTVPPLDTPFIAVAGLAIAPTTPSTVYVAISSVRCSGGGCSEVTLLFRSRDGGATWQDVSAGLHAAFRSLVVDPQAPMTLYTSGLDKTTDGGDHWAALPSPGFGVRDFIWVDPRASGTVYVQGFKSSDGGMTWVPGSGLEYGQVVVAMAPDGPSPDSLFAALVALVGPGGVYRSVDGGLHWSPTTLVGPGVPALVADPVVPGALWAGTAYATDYPDAPAVGVVRSSDQGQTWIPRNAGLTSELVGGVVVDPALPDTWYVGSADGGLFRTTDGGQTWSPINDGVSFLRVAGIAVDPVAPGVLYASVFHNPGIVQAHLVKSQDRGASWQTLPFGGPGLVAVVPMGSASTVFAGGIEKYGAGLGRSVDGGMTWTAAEGLPFPFPVVALAPDRGNPAVLYAGAAGAPGLMKSTDGGANWQAARAGIPDAYPRVTALVSTAPGTVYAGVAGESPSTLVGALFVSQDGGATWGPTALAGPVVWQFAFDPRLPSLLYAATDHGVLRSADGGARWGPINGGLPALSLGGLALAAAPGRPIRLIAAVPGVGVFVRAEQPALRLTPPTGRYAPSQRFDIGLVVESPTRVVGGTATFDGRDVSAALAACMTPGTALAGGRTLRCPGVSGDALGPGPHTFAVDLALDDGSTVADSVVWDVSSPAAGAAISPPGGILLGTQGWDLVVMGPIGASTLGLGRASFGGIDLTETLTGCVASGPTATLGPILRCPGVTGALLDSAGPGPHDLTLELDVGGQPVTSHVTWDVVPNTEP